MTDILTPAEAWDIFYKSFKGSFAWKMLDESERHYLRKTNKQVAAGLVGDRRIKKALERHAPGRFEYVGGFRQLKPF